MSPSRGREADFAFRFPQEEESGPERQVVPGPARPGPAEGVHGRVCVQRLGFSVKPVLLLTRLSKCDKGESNE